MAVSGPSDALSFGGAALAAFLVGDSVMVEVSCLSGFGFFLFALSLMAFLKSEMLSSSGDADSKGQRATVEGEAVTRYRGYRPL